MEALACRRGLRFCGAASDGALLAHVAGGLTDCESLRLRQAGVRVRWPGARIPADLEIEATSGAPAEDRSANLIAAARRWFRDRPLVGGVLVGGASRRMGRDKALLPWGRGRWIDRQVRTLARVADETFLAGRPIDPHPGLADADGSGPLAGIWALAQARPLATLLVVAVDQPLLTASALRWLRRQRRVGTDVVLPQLHGRLAPLPIVIEPPAFAALGRLARAGRGPRALLEVATVSHPEVPQRFVRSWRDFDAQTDLATFGLG
jgi:molybdopterin-guanine dinucleotide biosynthesis protein A